MKTSIDSTGIVFFEGEPRVTDGLRSWLKPLLIDGQFAVTRAVRTFVGVPGIQVCCKDPETGLGLDLLREPMRQALERKLAEQGRLRHSCGGIDPQELLTALAAAFGEEEFARRIESSHFDHGQLTISEVVEMAMRFGDGHNVKGVAVLWGLHSDQTRLWAFDGGSEVLARGPDGVIRSSEFNARGWMQSALAYVTGAYEQSRYSERLGPHFPLMAPSEAIRVMHEAANCEALAAAEPVYARERGG